MKTLKNNYKLYGAILGDLAGQPYEFRYNGDYSEFNLHDERSIFTDDTLMTLAVAAKLLGHFKTYEEAYKTIGLKYEGDYYGKGFAEWLKTPKGTINDSWGNGCLMRISPIMYTQKSWVKKHIDVIDSVLPSHDVYESKQACYELTNLYLNVHPFNFILRHVHSAKKFEKFDVTAKGTIKFIKHVFPIFTSTQEAIETVVKCGGDTDTNASIIGELLNYKRNDLTQQDIDYVESKLDPYLLGILKEFNSKF